MSPFKHLHLSIYPEDHIVHGKTNKKVQLTMTDELIGKFLKEVVCLLSKLKRYEYLGGTKRSAKSEHKPVKKNLHQSLYKNCVLSNPRYEKE